MENVVSPRMRWKEVLAVLGVSKSYGHTLVRRGLLRPHRESPRYTWFLREEVLALATGGAAAVADHAEEPAQEPAGEAFPQIVNTQPKAVTKRRGRPRKVREVIR